MMTGFRKILATSIAVGALAMSGCGDDETNTTMASSDGGSSTGATTTVSTSLTAGTTTAGTTTAGTTTMGTTTDGTTTMGTTTDATGGSTGDTGTTGADTCVDVDIMDLAPGSIQMGQVPIGFTQNIMVGDGATPDVFLIEYWLNDDTGVFDLSVPPEDDYATCAKCLRIQEDLDAMGVPVREFFQSQGTFEIDAATPPSGGAPLVTFTGVRLVEVTLGMGGASTPVPNGACIDIVDGTVQTATPPEADCGNGIDDNGNGATDCGDVSCAADAACTGPCMAPTQAVLGINNGDTVGGGNAFQSTCNNFGGLENIWTFTPANDGLLTITLGSVTDQGFSVRTNCADAGTQIECRDVEFGGTDEVGTINVTNGVEYIIIVDGFAAGEEGPYTLDLDLQVAVAEICNNGIDDDLDGDIDCADASCAADAVCTGACMGGSTAVLGANAGDTTGGSNLFESACNNFGGLEDIWTHAAAANGPIVVRLDSGTDQGFEIRSSCPDAATALTCEDAFFTTQEVGAFQALSGTTYGVIVDGFGAGDEGPYTLTLDQPALDAEAEGNDDYLTANAIANDGFIGSHPAGDEDWFSVTLGGVGTINAITLGQVGNCDGDTIVEIYDTDGITMLTSNDDGGPGACSSASEAMLPAGTYFVRVIGFDQMDVFDYGLFIETP